MPDPVSSEMHRPSVAERVFAIVLAVVLVAVLSFVIISDEVDLDDNKMRLAMVLMALLAGAVGAMLPGLLNLRYAGGGLTIRALGGGAFFLVVLYLGLGVPGRGGFAGEDGFRQDDVTQMIRNARDQLGGNAGAQPYQPPSYQPPSYTPSYSPSYNSSPPAYAAGEYHVLAQCSVTGAVGEGWGADPVYAQDRAIRQCRANGGLPGCCQIISSVYE